MDNYENKGAPRDVEELLFDKDNPPWNVITATSYWIFSVLAILICQSVVTIAYAAYTGLSFKKSIEDPTSLILAIGSVLPAHLITLFVGWMIVTRMGKHSFGKMVGMDWGGFRWWHLILILLGMVVLFALFLSIFGEKTNDFDRLLKSSRAAVYIVAFMATFSAPIVEEVIYRGVFYSAVKRSLNTFAAVVLVSVLFAGVHLPQYWGDMATISSLLTLSIVLTLVRVFTGNLLPCIALHFVFNGIQTSLLILEPWIKQASEKPAPGAGFLY